MKTRLHFLTLLLTMFIVAQTYESCPVPPGGDPPPPPPPPPPGEVQFGPEWQEVIDGINNQAGMTNVTNRTDLYHQHRKMSAAVIADIGVQNMIDAGFNTYGLTEQQYCDLADASYLADRTRMMSGQTDTHSDWADGYPEFQFWPAALFRVWCDPYLSQQRQDEIEADFIDVLESFFGATPWACDAMSIPFVSHVQFINNRGIENLAMLPLALALENQADPWWVLADCVFRERIPNEAAIYLSQGYWDMEASVDYMRMTTTWLLTTYAIWFSDMMESEVWLNDLGSFYDDLWTGSQWFNFGTATSDFRSMNYFCYALGIMSTFNTPSGAIASWNWANDGNCMSSVGAGIFRHSGLWGKWMWAWPRTAQSTWLSRVAPAEQLDGQRQHGNGWFTSDAGGDKLHIFAKLIMGYGHDSNHTGAVYIGDRGGEILYSQQLGNKNGSRRYTSSHGRHHGINVSCYSGSGVQFERYEGWADAPGSPPQYDMETVGVIQEVDTTNPDFLYHRYGRDFGGADSEVSPGLIQEIVHLYDERIIVGRYTFGLTPNCTPVFLAHIADNPGTGPFPTSTVTVQTSQLDTSEPMDNYYHDMQDADIDEGGDSIIGGNFNFQMPACMRIMCGNVRSYDIASGFMWVVQLGPISAVSFDGNEVTIGGVTVTINGTGAVVTGI